MNSSDQELLEKVAEFVFGFKWHKHSDGVHRYLAFLDQPATTEKLPNLRANYLPNFLLNGESVLEVIRDYDGATRMMFVEELQVIISERLRMGRNQYVDPMMMILEATPRDICRAAVLTLEP